MTDRDVNRLSGTSSNRVAKLIKVDCIKKVIYVLETTLQN